LDTTSNPVTLIDSTNNSLDTTKIHTGLLNDITYYIRITAIEWSRNERSFSNEVYATPVYIDSIARPYLRICQELPVIAL